jgi:hypothetical protein
MEDRRAREQRRRKEKFERLTGINWTEEREADWLWTSEGSAEFQKEIMEEQRARERWDRQTNRVVEARRNLQRWDKLASHQH